MMKPIRFLTACFLAGCFVFCGCAAQQQPQTVAGSEEQPESITEKDLQIRSEAAQQPPLDDLIEQPQEQPLLRFAIIADMNGRYGSDQYDAEVVKSIDMIIADRPDIVINVGDMVAGQKPKLDYRKMWVGFHAVVTSRLADAGILMAQVPGNHDASAYEKYQVEREIYIDEWNQRKPALDYVDDSNYPLYYSFKHKGVFFIALDATKLEPLDDVQYEWLAGQLANNPTEYGAIVIAHVPLFPITTIKPTEILRDDRLPDLFSKHRVQMMVTGHQHAYFPAQLNGVIYLHTGALGGGPRPVRQNDGIVPKTLTYVSLYKNHPPYIDTELIANGQHVGKFNHNLLPTYIMFGNSILPRVDIQMDDAEFAREYMISPHMTRSQMLTLIEALKANDGNWSKLPDWRENQ